MQGPALPRTRVTGSLAPSIVWGSPNGSYGTFVRAAGPVDRFVNRIGTVIGNNRSIRFSRIVALSATAHHAVRTARGSTTLTPSIASMDGVRVRAARLLIWRIACFLKTNVTALRLDPRSITGVRSSLGKLPGVPDNARMEPPFRGKYFPGSGYSVVTVSSVEGCSDNCYRDLACVAYSFTRAD